MCQNGVKDMRFGSVCPSWHRSVTHAISLADSLTLGLQQGCWTKVKIVSKPPCQNNSLQIKWSKATPTKQEKMTLVYLTLVCWGPDMIIRGSVIWWSPVRALSRAKHVLRQFVLAVNRLCGAKRCGVCVNFQNFVSEVAHEIAFPFWISCLQSVSHAQTRT